MSTRTPRTGTHLVTLPRGLGPLQFAAATVEGLVLSSITVHALVRLAVGAETVGLVLAGAAAVALLVTPLCGAVADRTGLTRAGAGYAVLSAVALATYALSRSVAGFAIAATLFITAQAAAGSVRQAIAVSGAPAQERTRLRATMHMVLNAGFGCGTMLGIAVLASAADAVFSGMYVLGALLAMITAVGTLRLQIGNVTSLGSSTSGALTALRDRPFTRVVALAGLVQLTMPILSLLLPVWVLHSAAPAWTAGLALAVNTAAVIAVQRPWSARLVDARSTTTSAAIAAGAIVIAGLILATLPHIDSMGAAVAAVVVAVVALTAAEVAGGAAVWQVALQNIDHAAEGRYQAAFSMSASGARILGPLVALPLVLRTVRPAGSC